MKSKKRGPSPAARRPPFDVEDRSAKPRRGRSPRARGLPRPTSRPGRDRRPSPRARGNHAPSRHVESSRPRAIPACAGHPASRRDSAGRQLGSSPRARGDPRVRLARSDGRAHPRVRGATRDPATRRLTVQGRSPRARGSTHVLRRMRVRGPSPRARGNLDEAARASSGVMGQSPRARGTARCVDPETARVDPRVRGAATISILPRHPLVRHIPACAGQPIDRSTACPSSGACVDPRVRGATGRGTLSAHAARAIPACAGQPSVASCSSPRCPGPLPACAGEPTTRAPARWPWGDPRVRGATLDAKR